MGLHGLLQGQLYLLFTFYYAYFKRPLIANVYNLLAFVLPTVNANLLFHRDLQINSLRQQFFQRNWTELNNLSLKSLPPRMKSVTLIFDFNCDQHSYNAAYTSASWI
jgi:hypothetical protein